VDARTALRKKPTNDQHATFALLFGTHGNHRFIDAHLAVPVAIPVADAITSKSPFFARPACKIAISSLVFIFASAERRVGSLPRWIVRPFGMETIVRIGKLAALSITSPDVEQRNEGCSE